MPTPSLLQRAKGHLLVDLKRRGPDTVLSDLRQDGCMKARFPRPVDWTEIVTLNSSGGIAGGDIVSSSFRVRENASATFASQAAERLYRALPADPPSHIRTTIKIEPGASAEWLPQETILFDQCAVDRVLDVEVANSAWFLGLETLVFGRTAMGESVTTARIADTIRIRHNGKLILHDAIRINGEVASTLAHQATAAGATSITTLILVSDTAAAQTDALREALAPHNAGVSAWNNMLVTRIAAANPRPAIIEALKILRNGRALPRVWHC